MEKDDINHAGFLSFMNNNNPSELKNMVAPKFDNVIKQYSYVGKKAIKHADGQECLKVKNEKISTYGENSFSDECASLINIYMLLQIANDKEIYHYTGYNLGDVDDTEFQNILSPDFTEFSGSDATGAL